MVDFDPPGRAGAPPCGYYRQASDSVSVSCFDMAFLVSTIFIYVRARFLRSSPYFVRENDAPI
jgi:hypothetical protein